MVTIEVLKYTDTTDEPNIQDTIQIPEIELSRIAPVNMQNGIPLSMNEILNLVSIIEPQTELLETELDGYFAQQISVYYDGELSLEELDIPHYIGLRVVLENLLQKYGDSTNLQVRIS